LYPNFRIREKKKRHIKNGSTRAAVDRLPEEDTKAKNKITATTQQGRERKAARDGYEVLPRLRGNGSSGKTEDFGNRMQTRRRGQKKNESDFA